MDKKQQYKDFLTLNNKQINTTMGILYRTNPTEFKEATDYFKSCERYQLDYVFKIIIDTFNIAYCTINGNYNAYKDTIDETLEQIESLENKQDLIANFFIIANGFAIINRIDKAIFCYMLVINISKEKNKFYAATAYHNIGELYQQHNNLKKALHYFEKSHFMLSPRPNGDNKHDYFWIYNTAEIAHTHYLLNNKENFLHYYRLCLEHRPEHLIKPTNIFFEKVNLHYHYIQGDFEEIKACYNRIQSQHKQNKNFPDLIDYTIWYYQFAQKLTGSTSDIIEIIKNIDLKEIETSQYQAKKDILHIIIDYHLDNNQIELAKPYIKKLYAVLDEYTKQNKVQNKKIMKLSFEQQKNIDETETAQEQLELLEKNQQDLLINNIAIKKIYDRLQIIHMIGSEITTVKNIEEIAKKTYNSLKSLLEIDNFTLLYINTKTNSLKSHFIYDIHNNREKHSFKLTINTIIDNFIKQKEIIKINNVNEETEYKTLLKQLNANLDIYHSALIIPLIFDQKTIAITYILATRKQAYELITTETIKQFATFMAIAINNVAREQNLIKIIKKQQKTEDRLNKLNKTLQKNSEVDSLTQVNNRRGFNNFYQHAIKKAKKMKQSINIFMIDIDYFKAYNDSFGHLQGDKIIKIIATELNQFFKEENQFFARYGGEEFIAFFSCNCTNICKHALEKAEKLRKTIENLVIKHPQSKFGIITISIGVATIKEATGISEKYIDLSDQALYQAKSKGRNRVEQIICKN